MITVTDVLDDPSRGVYGGRWRTARGAGDLLADGDELHIEQLGMRLTLARTSEGQVLVKRCVMLSAHANDAGGSGGVGEPDASCDCAELLDIAIPEGVTAIGDYAFGGLNCVAHITIPDSVASIGSDAFCDCKNLRSITLPKKLTALGDRVFCGCESLADITIPEGVRVIGESAFRSCRSLVSVTLPKGMETIARDAFDHCYSLMSVAIPDSVTEVGEKAFYDCVRLSGIALPEGVTDIARLTFAGCVSLKHIELSDKITKLGTGIFGHGHMPELTSGFLPGAILEEWGPHAQVILAICYLSSSERHPEEAKDAYESYIRRNRKTIIAKIMEQQNLPILESLLMRGLFSVKAIDEYIEEAGRKQQVDMLAILLNHKNTFFTREQIDRECYRKMTANPFSVAEMKKVWVFEQKPDDTYAIVEYRGTDVNVEVPMVIGKQLVTEIRDRAFWGLARLTNVTIPDSVTKIGEAAFCNCFSLTRIAIPESVNEIGAHAFYGCRNLKEIAIPDSVTEIGMYALGGLISPTVRTTAGSCAQQHAEDNGLRCVLEERAAE